MLSNYERLVCQLLQHLGHKSGRDTIFLGNLTGAASMLLAMHRQMLDSNQTVIGFLGKLEHRSMDLLDWDAPEYATESVADGVYPCADQKSIPNRLPFEYKPCISNNLEYD